MRVGSAAARGARGLWVAVVRVAGSHFAVCDGMGGAAAGEVASHMAVDTLFEQLARRFAPPTDRDDVRALALVTSVEEAGARIFLAAKKDRTRRGMGTTATVAGLIDKVLFIGQVGDSRCYLLRNGRLSLVTKDQSLVNQLIEAGQLTEDEAEAFEHSNIILQALGTTEQVAVDLTFVELRRGDRILLCSDGLSGLVHDEVIRQEMACVGPLLEQLADRLIDLANAAGGHDNITCIVADFDGSTRSTRPNKMRCRSTSSTRFLAADEGRSALPVPGLPHVVKSMVPRAMTRAKRARQPARERCGAAERQVGVMVDGWRRSSCLLGLAVSDHDWRQRAVDAIPPTELAPPPPAYADAQVPVEVRVQCGPRRAVSSSSTAVAMVRSAWTRRSLLRLSLRARITSKRANPTARRLAKTFTIEPGLPTEVVLIPPTD